MKIIYAIVYALFLVFIPALSIAQTVPSAILTWKDNSGIDPTKNDQEVTFIIESNVNGGAWAVKFKTAADAITYADNSVYQTPGVDNKFCYRVIAENATGKSVSSNVACITYAAAPIPQAIPAPVTNLTVK